MGWHIVGGGRGAVTPAFSPNVLITSHSLNDAMVSRSYAQVLSAINGTAPYTWSLISCTPNTGNWLSVSPAGTILGTPGTAETETLVIQAQDSSGRLSSPKTLTLVVDADLVITSATLPTATVGVAYSSALQATGGAQPYSWTSANITPDTGNWVNVSISGTVSGTPGTAETESIQLQLTDANGYLATKTVTLPVQGTAQLMITTSSLPNAQVGSAYSYTMQAANGTPPYVWNLESDSPNYDLWESISGAGVLSGTPQMAETETLVIRVTDSVGATVTATLSQLVTQ